MAIIMIPGLDGLRGIAFLLVFAQHTHYIKIGWTGVSMFFVLSGFLITGILLDMKKAHLPREYFTKFYGRRFLRIFPLYYFYLLLMVGLTTWLISVPYRQKYMQTFLDQVWYAVFYVYDFFFGTATFRQSNFLDHLWSLSVEEQFYIFWPLLILLTPERHLKKLFIGFIVLGALFRVGVFVIHRAGVFQFLGDSATQAIYPLPFSHLDAFALGGYISRFPIRKARAQFLWLAAVIPVLGFGTQYLATGTIGEVSALGYPLLLPDAYKFLWGYTLLYYFFAVLIYGVARKGWAVRLLEWKPLRYLGKISYGLYIYHFPIVWFANRIADLEVEPSFRQPLIALLSFTATLVVASLSYFLMERPLLSLKDHFFSINRAETPG